MDIPQPENLPSPGDPKKFTPIIVIGSVFAVLKAGVDSIKDANDTRNLILGITEKAINLNYDQMKILYEDDWFPLQVGITVSFLVIAILYFLVPVFYDRSSGGWLSGIGAAVLMLIAFVGNYAGYLKDNEVIRKRMDSVRPFVLIRMPAPAAGRG